MKTKSSPHWLNARFTSALLATLLTGVGTQAQAQQAYTVAKPLTFYDGNPKAQAKLSRIPDARELVAERFRLAIEDLNGDGRPELIVQSASSAFCGSGGCTVMVFEQQGNRMVTLHVQNLPGDLAITNEKVGGYRALAALDGKSGIQIADKAGTPLHDKQMVYAMSNVRGSNPEAATPSPSAPQHAAKAEEAPPRGNAQAGSTSPSVPGLTAPPAGYAVPAWAERLDVVGVKIGMPAEQALAVLRNHNPRMRISSSSFELELWAKPAVAVIVALDGSIKDHGLDEEVTLRLALPPQRSVVIEALRWNNYKEGDSPSKDDVLAALRSKYGAMDLVATEAYGTRTQYVAYLDSSGKPIPGTGKCYPTAPNGRWSAIKKTSDIGTSFGQISQSVKNLTAIAAACGSLVTATIETYVSNSGLVAQLGVRVSNERFQAESFKASAEYALALDAKRKAGEVEKAKGKPLKM